jgi:two-component system sensor histidine kinase CpxA
MSVFSKIFLSFWLALIVTIILTAFLHPIRGEAAHAAFRDSMSRLLVAQSREFLQDLQQGRQQEVRSAVSTLGRNSGIQLYLLDTRGNEVTGRTIPNDVRLAIAEEEGDNPENSIITREITDENDHHYQMVAQFTGARRARMQFGFWFPRGLLLLITSGIVCFVLARYLTAPIVRLRAAAQQFAGGELHARAEVSGARKDEIGLVVNEFNRMAERIASLITMQRRLLTDISHELRSPLARLTIAIGLLRKKTGPDAAPMLDRVEREAERLDQMIGELLTLSSFESGQNRFPSAEFSFADIVAEVADDADYEARDRGCHVRVQVDQDCRLSGNPELLHRAVENVVRNAVRYTAPYSTVDMTLQADTHNPHPVALLRVRDHGPGVPETETKNIFQPFYRLADARDRQSGGTGLGLAISEKAVRLHGGDICATNASDGGLVVEIRIPMQASAKAESA